MIRRFLAPVLAALLLALGSAGPAGAAGYRYWSFWEHDGGRWTYASEGPATARPGDGDVHGFRFSVSADSQDSARPRGTARFGEICAGTPAREGKKRVALVLDFGTAADAPSGETPPPARTACASVAPDASAAQALAAVAGPLRYNANALLCAISGYPRQGCGEQVGTDAQKDAAPSEEETAKGTAEESRESGGGPSLGLLAGAAAVLALGAAAGWQARRRRDA